MFGTSEQYSLLTLLEKGGWAMVPLVLCSLIAVAVVIYRLFWGPQRSRVIPSMFLNELRSLIKENRLDEVIGLCRGSAVPLARVLVAALRNLHKPREQVIEAMELAGRKEAVHLQKFLGVLGTIAAITPLLGLLGTVFGMINSFTVFKMEGIGNADVLSSGIAEALITTASGLVIAIPTLVFYRYFLYNSKILVMEMEETSLSLLDEIENVRLQPAESFPSKHRAV